MSNKKYDHSMSAEAHYYPNYDDTNFDEILNKYEFLEKDKRKIVYQDPRQLILRNLISKNTIYDNILLYWQTGTGKCMKKDTPILMFDGTIKKIQNIKKGELVMGDDSKKRKVLSLARGTDKMYDIIPVKGEKYTVNSEHILCLKFSDKPNLMNNKYNSVTWFDIKNITKCKKNFKTKKDAEEFLKGKQDEYLDHKNIIEISVKEYLKLPDIIKSHLKGYKVPIDFPNKNLKIDPYMIGFWLGDGSQRDPIITTQDSTIVKYFKTNLEQYKCYLQYGNKYKYRINGDGSGKENSNKFLNTLKNLDLINNKHIPLIYKCNSRENRLKLLAGLIDSDGHYDNKNNIYEFTQGLEHEQIIDDVIYLCRSLGFACYKNKKQTSYTYKGEKIYGEAWRINISGEGIQEIPVLCPRKKATPRKQIKDVLVTGIKVKYIKEDNYYGFTLDGNSRYVMGDFTVTHNSCAAITIAEGFKEYVANMGRRILVLVKNSNIENNFRHELLSQCTERDPYITEYNKGNQNKINRSINKIYDFITYGSFVNRVLGLKQFEKDLMGRNTSKQLKDQGKGLRRKPQDAITQLNNTVIIIDEAHNVTNNDVYLALSKVLENSYNYRIVLLTATPMYDNPKEIFEISNLLNMNNPDKIFPIRNKLYPDFVERGESDYLKQSVLKSGLISVTDTGKELLSNSLLGKVSYLQANKETFPEKRDMGEPLLIIKGKPVVGTINIVPCYMSKYQYKIYKTALKTDSKTSDNDINDIDESDAEENVEEEITFIKSSSLYKNSSDASTMTYPENSFGKDGFNLIFKEKKKNGNVVFELNENYLDVFTTDLKKYSAKLYKLLENIKNSPGNVFVYSNYVNQGGTSLIKELLLANGYHEYNGRTNNKNAFILYDDTTNPETREHLRKVFNSSENKDGEYIKIIIGSPVISEGITLKNVNQVHILEPSWNMSRINQIIGRAIRHHSHDDLPERKYVEIYKYCSIYENETKDDSFIDKEKYILSEEKDRSNKEIERLLKTVAFDCNINKQENKGKDYTPECDYTKCKYTCAIKSNEDNFKDKYTYNLYVNFFDHFDIEINTHLIKNLFKKYFIWTQDDIIDNLKSIEPMISNESIFTALKQLIDNKTLISDRYDRSGYIIQKGNYFIFNSIDIDINTSIFSKILDFSKNTNEFTLSDYAEKTLDKSIKKKEVDTKETKKKKDPIEQVTLSKADIKYNQNIIDNYKIYGLYRAKPIGEELFGPIDDVFRINIRKETDNPEDKRKKISGMRAGSYTKDDLIDIIKKLKINIKDYKNSDNLNIKNLAIKQLIEVIEKYMKDHKLILR
jgi:superfamily II DNA or RNA helicase